MKSFGPTRMTRLLLGALLASVTVSQEASGQVSPDEGPPWELGRYAVSVDAQASSDFRDFALSTELFEILEVERPENFLRLQASMSKDTVELQDVQFQWEEYSLKGDAALQRLQIDLL